MKKLKIKILDPVHSQTDSNSREIIKHCLSYKKEYWHRGQFNRELRVNTQHMITGRKGTGGIFLTGFIPRIKNYSREIGFKLEISGQLERLRPKNKPDIKGIKFRDDQISVFKAVRRNHFGRITAPTGTGKTLLEIGIISMFPSSNILLLAHTKDLTSQLKQSIKQHLPDRKYFNPKGSQEIENLISSNDFKDSILITTIQSLANVNPSLYITTFDITIVDECHHVTRAQSQYGKVMTHNLSPRKYGFTATLPTKQDELLFNEGIFGKVISDFTYKEAKKNDVIARPKIKLLNISFNPKINQEAKNRYHSIYDLGIIKNKERNAAICQEAFDSISTKRPTLIIIEKIEHGELIKEKMMNNYNLDIPFISGESKQEERLEYKKELLSGKTLCIIVSRIWMEGINIPNLKTIIYAPGMKEKKKVIQAMGRGLRTSKGKTEILLIDCLDPYRYLAEHSISRFQVYNEMGWI